MDILIRFRDIMASNINSLLDKVENPEKMIDQCLRNLNSDLGKVKSETAAIMAEEQRAKRRLNECIAEMNKLQNYAIKALESHNEEDARKFLERKSTLATKVTGLKEAYELGASNASKMREMHDKLVTDIRELESRKVIIKGKLTVAKTKERINNIRSSVGSANHFDRMEEKANKAIYLADAMAELYSGPEDDIKDLMTKYSSKDTNIDHQLEALKEDLKKNNL
ncbi:PspA/IM30 family protein [Bacillaceae bacterium IKA-2]|nr:PspA/IM30 family protein [Bacillaceae bacterium IKA-2]